MTVTQVNKPLSSAPPQGRITPESIAAAEAMIGTYLRPEGPFLQDVSVDTIRNFCNGTGDLNPLFRDLEYGRRSPLGSIVAHPLMPQAFGYIGRTRWGFPGVHGFYAGGDWEFFRYWRPSDRINCVERVVGVEIKESRFSGQLALQYTEGTFTNQRGELVARALGWCTRHERQTAKDTGKYRDISDSNEYSPEELDQIQVAELAEEQNIRGSHVRYWEDVAIGESLDPIVRGPLSVMDLEAFHVAVGRGLASGILLRQALRHPNHYFRNPEHGGALEYTGIGHSNPAVAKNVGVPGGYDYGPQRFSWMGSLVTNWMGDHAFLKRIRGEMRRFNVIGDTTTCSGKVVRKYQKDRYALVDLEIQAVNQRGETTAPGLATVALPSRDINVKTLIDGSDLELELPTVR